ncbi:hypothetical protein RFI_02851 [Reticulomyxa filosa]|uniref:Uncharacterized protein n=1 Tax=Reticulomyxa filosa TaxID=46433 RepID=X6P6S7_RETFI|nr:hypothetical protein RFI_02851 [Reticulomyxa filosa]|eukprot:ETO34245.1 hypothetical protein RFI_02851 [Reticulomyxa filosa]
MACRVPKCTCKQFMSSRWQVTKCDCGHTQGQHNELKTLGTKDSLPTAASPQTLQVSAVQTKQLSSNETEHKEQKSEEKKTLAPSQGLSTSSSSSSSSSANKPDKEKEGEKDERISVANRMSRVPLSNDATTTTQPKVSTNNNANALQPSSRIEIQPKPSVTTLAKATPQHSDHLSDKASSNPNAAVEELKEYIFECNQELGNFVGLEAKWTEAYKEKTKAIDDKFEELYEALKHRQSSLKQDVGVVYQQKLDEIHRQTALTQSTIDALSKVILSFILFYLFK